MNSKRKGNVHKQTTTAFADMIREHCRNTGDREIDVADVLRISPPYLSNLLSGEHPIPIDLVVLAARDLDCEPSAIQVACRLCGGTFCPTPDVPETSADVLRTLQRCIDAMEIYSTWLKSVSESVVDGRVTLDELDRCRGDFDRLLVNEYQTMATIDAMAERRSTGRVVTLAATASRAS